jgi:hypothetical protein
MRDPSIALHRPDGSVIMVRAEHIDSRRPADANAPGAKTVILIDGTYQAVRESMSEIAALIAEA